MTCYLHHVPGRIRVRIPSIKYDYAQAEGLQEKLESLTGVTTVYANALTGSVLVNYDPAKINAGVILDLIGREHGIDLSTAANSDQYVDERLTRTGEKIGKAVFGMMVGKMLEGTPLALLGAFI
ncbi:MAG: HMA2 domain-containing protein [Syntrophobacteraceae bacterium]